MRKIYALSTIVLLTAIMLVGCNQTPDNPSNSDAEPTTSTQTVAFANFKCPIMGGKPKAELTTQYESRTIGFCCDGCPEKWAALSDEEKAEKFATVSHKANDAHSGHGEHDDHANHDHGDNS